jgi:asparagine synthase (glutamine-hydrolysing)
MDEQREILIKRIRSRNLTYLSEARLQNIYTTISEIEKSEIPGVFIEAGCALGGSSILIASEKKPDRRLFIYDVFGMIPPPSGQDSAEVHHRFKIISEGKSKGIGGEKYYGYIENLLEVVKSNYSLFDIDPEAQSVSFIKDLIQETMQIDEPVAFAHIDVDWYEAVRFCLQTIFPALSVGGSIIVDDYFDWEGCKKATDAFLSQFKGRYVTDSSSGALKITRVKSEESKMDKNSKDFLSFNEISIEDFLKKYSGKEVVYCANPGNAGDAIIAHATFQLFEKLNIRPQIITQKDVVMDKIIIYSGGGNLVEGKYRNAYHFIKNNYSQNKEIILLPHTVHGYDELLLSANNLTIICREKISYRDLSSIGFSPERLFLAHDMAFLLQESEFQEFLQKGKGVANCFRTDQESAIAFEIPKNNLDISLSWNGNFWHRSDFAKNVTHNLACYLSAFETLKTDRLHIAILAGILGKRVVLYPNNYYKIKAVYEYSMKNVFDNVKFIEVNQPAVTAHNSQTNHIQEKINLLEKTLQEKDHKIAGLSVAAEKLNEVLQSKSWKITKPMRDLMTLFKRK